MGGVEGGVRPGVRNGLAAAVAAKKRADKIAENPANLIVLIASTPRRSKSFFAALGHCHT